MPYMTVTQPADATAESSCRTMLAFRLRPRSRRASWCPLRAGQVSAPSTGPSRWPARPRLDRRVLDMRSPGRDEPRQPAGVAAQEILTGLAADQRPGPAGACGDDRRPGDMVVDGWHGEL